MLDLDILSERQSYELEKYITHVALYPRKSRPTGTIHSDEDIEKDLENQISSLKRLCMQKGWSYEMYTEIQSGENIKNRPKMSQLLKDIEDDKFDAVLVTDYTRLGRGSGADQEKMLITLRQNATVIVEGSGRILNPLNENDLQIMNMQGFFSNTEYKGITLRFTRGKRDGARKGQWVSGHAPYGYDFNRKTKKLTINKEQGDIYRNHILLPFLNGQSTSEIANNLNELKIHSPRNTSWTKTTIINLLKSEVYKGEIVYNKTVGNKSKEASLNSMPFRKLKEEDWIRAFNAHPYLKTEEEHEEVIKLFSIKGRSKGINKNHHPLSALVKCYSCDKTLRIQRKSDSSYLRSCECGATKGGDCDLVSEAIMQGALGMRTFLLGMKTSNSTDYETKIIQKEIELLNKELESEYDAIDRIEEAYEMNVYDINKMTAKKEKRELRINQIKEELKDKNKELKDLTSINSDEKVSKIDKFISYVNNSNFEGELSKAYREILEKVIWKRTLDEEVEVFVKFL